MWSANLTKFQKYNIKINSFCLLYKYFNLYSSKTRTFPDPRKHKNEMYM